jgi:peptidyl-prolyl cis-trans isomerase C
VAQPGTDANLRYNRILLSKQQLSLAFALMIGVSVAACRNAPEPAPANASTAGTAAQPAASAGSAAAAALPPAAPPQTPAAPAAAVPEQLPNVLARVNNEDVRKDDFDRLLRNIEINNGPVPPDRRNEILRKVLDELVTYTLLKQESKARNITISDAEVDEQIKAMRQGARSNENFEKALAARKMTVERLKTDARVELAIARMMNDVVASTTAVTDDEAKQFYEKNPDRFKRDEMVRASHILIMADEKADATVKQQARAKIDAVWKRAKAGADFAALAKENSMDGSAAQGGDLNFFPRQKMVKPFADAAFALKVGEISDVVTSQFGYHVIKVTDRKPAGAVPLEEVSTQLKNYLTEQKKQQQAQSFIDQLKQKAKIEVLI